MSWRRMRWRRKITAKRQLTAARMKKRFKLWWPMRLAASNWPNGNQSVCLWNAWWWLKHVYYGLWFYFVNLDRIVLDHYSVFTTKKGGDSFRSSFSCTASFLRLSDHHRLFLTSHAFFFSLASLFIFTAFSLGFVSFHSTFLPPFSFKKKEKRASALLDWFECLDWHPVFDPGMNCDIYFFLTALI